MSFIDDPARAGWLAWRKEGLGGTDVAAIAGDHPYRGPWDVWLEKMHGTEQPPSPAMITGSRLEPIVAEFAAWSLGAAVRSAVRIEGRTPWTRGTPDYWLDLPEGQTFGLECKTARYPDAREGWGEAGSDQVPKHYAVQCAWYQMLTGCDIWILAVFFKAADDWRLYWLDRDVDREVELFEVAGAWWQRHIIGGEPPDIDDTAACKHGLANLNPQPPKRTPLRVATVSEEQLIRSYADMSEARDQLTRAHNDLGNHIRNGIGGDRGVRFSGGRATWTRGRTNRLHVRIDP